MCCLTHLYVATDNINKNKCEQTEAACAKCHRAWLCHVLSPLPLWQQKKHSDPYCSVVPCPSESAVTARRFKKNVHLWNCGAWGQLFHLMMEGTLLESFCGKFLCDAAPPTHPRHHALIAWSYNRPALIFLPAHRAWVCVSVAALRQTPIPSRLVHWADRDMLQAILRLTWCWINGWKMDRGICGGIPVSDQRSSSDMPLISLPSLCSRCDFLLIGHYCPV